MKQERVSESLDGNKTWFQAENVYHRKFGPSSKWVSWDWEWEINSIVIHKENV